MTSAPQKRKKEKKVVGSNPTKMVIACLSPDGYVNRCKMAKFMNILGDSSWPHGLVRESDLDA